jgi:hypothetical protein
MVIAVSVDASNTSQPRHRLGTGARLGELRKMRVPIGQPRPDLIDRQQM